MKRHQYFFILSAVFIMIGLLLPFSQADAASPRGLAAPRNALPSELGQMDIKDYYAATGAKGIGTIKSVVGHAVVFREDRRYAYYAASGDRVFERDVVYTLKGSRCRVQLDTSDVATMGENTRLMIKTYLDNRQTKVKSTTFAVNRGKAMFYALRLFKYRGASMEVETPTAVSGVRGTKWGIEVVELEGKPVASLPVQVADLSDAGFRHLAQANQPQTQTNVYSFEGSIRVTSTMTGLTTTLSGGQGLNAGGTGLGNPFTTPPGVASQFQADTSAPGGGGSGISGGSTGAGSGSNFPETSGSGVGTGSGSNLPDISSVTQNQNLSNLATPTNRPTNHEGFFGVMLASTYPSLSFNSGMMSTTAQDFNSSPIQSSDPFGSLASITAHGSNGSFNPTITDVKSSGGTSMTSGVNVTVNHTELGYNAYVEWGYWTQPQSMSIGIDTYAFIDRGYYVQGDVTTNAQMAALQANGVVGTYTGKAYGTYSDSSGAGFYMPNGNFNATVNFSTRSIPSFNFSVTDGTRTASVAGASGSFSGSTGQFNVTGGTVSLTGTELPSHRSYGAIYGSNGQAIGGVWGIMGGAGIAATGIFQGVR